MNPLSMAIQITKQVNALLAARFKNLGTPTARLKKNEEIVTRADIEANRLYTKFLLKHFPDDDIISEEAKQIDNPGKKIWFIDPLDGTTNFAYGFRLFATCLARLSGNKIEIGAIGLPMDQEIFWASARRGAFLNGKKIKVAKKHNHRSRDMYLFCGGHSNNGQKALIDIMHRINPNYTRFRSLSSAGIELSSVACGRADGCVLPEVHPWDVLAGIILVKEAGGVVTNFKGEEWTLKDSAIIASNGHCHEKLLRLVR